MVAEPVGLALLAVRSLCLPTVRALSVPPNRGRHRHLHLVTSHTRLPQRSRHVPMDKALTGATVSADCGILWPWSCSRAEGIPDISFSRSAFAKTWQ